MQYENNPLQGVIVGTPTPFTEDRELDEERFADHLDWILEKDGIHGLTITPGAGEFYALTFDEWKRCVDIGAQKANEHDVLVEANFGAESYTKTMRQVRYSEEVGLDLVRIIQPYYVKPSQDGYLDYYGRIADSTDLPIHLYPAYLTDRHIEPSVIVELAKRDNIVGMKVHHQSMPELAHISSLTRGDNFQVIPGANSRFYHMYRAGMCNATHGVEPLITPEWSTQLWNALKREDWEKAEAVTKKLNELYSQLLPTDARNIPAQYKYALKLVGRDFGPCRYPIPELSEEEKRPIETVLKRYDLLDSR